MHDRPCDNVQLWVICVLRNDPFGLFRVNLYFVEEHPDAVAGFDGEGKLDVSAGNVFEREICPGGSIVGRKGEVADLGEGLAVIRNREGDGAGNPDTGGVAQM